jgi:superfamily II DNA/RNA helicase
MSLEYELFLPGVFCKVIFSYLYLIIFLLYSRYLFTNIPFSLNLEQILQKLEIPALNEMQVAALKALEKKRDLLLYSPTGSGKTLGFLLPVLSHFDPEIKGVQALVLVPSRELAIQIEQVFRAMGTGYKVSCCYGGHSTKTEKNNLLQSPAILIGTPGRISHHLRLKSFDPLTVQTLILDEFDKSLEFGFKEEMSSIIGELSALKTRVLTSATELKEIPAFVRIQNPIELNYLHTNVETGLEVKYVRAGGKDKLDVLFALICKLGNEPSLVFCNHREAVDRISELLRDKHLPHDVFHGGMEQDERERALIKFRNGSHHLLITTDLASRGLDIPEIRNVIHYQLPVNETVFTHRNGRTARMHAEGTSYLVLGEAEYLPSFIQGKPTEEKMPAKNQLPPPSPWMTLFMNAGKKEKISKGDIAGLLMQKGDLKKDELGRIEVLDHGSFAAIKREKAGMVLDLVRNEKLKKKTVRFSLEA